MKILKFAYLTLWLPPPPPPATACLLWLAVVLGPCDECLWWIEPEYELDAPTPVVVLLLAVELWCEDGLWVWSPPSAAFLLRWWWWLWPWCWLLAELLPLLEHAVPKILLWWDCTLEWGSSSNLWWLWLACCCWYKLLFWLLWWWFAVRCVEVMTSVAEVAVATEARVLMSPPQ